MANPEHVEIVKRGAEAIREWRKSNPDGMLDLYETSLSQADFGGVDLHRVNLNGAYLERTSFSKANLIEADLRRAFLRGADLRGADLGEANLSGANLSGADLSGANLGEADLSGADLHWAKLSKANFRGADLRGADLDGATVGWTTFSDVALLETKGLGTVQHGGPSTVGVDTLVKCQGQLPDEFLRGCGLSDWQIAFARLCSPKLGNDKITTIGYDIINGRIGSPLQFFSAFISYSHDDKEFARKLHDALQAKGIRCWLDEHQILPGDDIYEQVDRGIRLWDKVLLCASKHSLTSWWVDAEIEKAFQREQHSVKDRGKRTLVVIPLNLDGFLFQWESGKASVVKSRLAADFTGWETDQAKFDREVERLIKALRADEGGREPAPPQLL